MSSTKQQISPVDKLFLKDCQFMIGATEPSSLPDTDFTEVAFVGRSNVGKSSLINALLNRRIARTSKSPGRTRQLNFFLLANRFYIVDMPGYGYAAVSRSEMTGWRGLLKAYFKNRSQLRRLFVLVDARHGLKPSDIELFNFIAQHPVNTQIVLTKIDKISAQELVAVTEQVTAGIRSFPMCHPVIIQVSSSKLLGMSVLRDAIIEATQVAVD